MKLLLPHHFPRALVLFGAAAAGVAIGLLTAPCKGSETRKKISKTTGSWVNSLGHLFTKGKNGVSEIASKAKPVV